MSLLLRVKELSSLKFKLQKHKSYVKIEYLGVHLRVMTQLCTLNRGITKATMYHMLLTPVHRDLTVERWVGSILRIGEFKTETWVSKLCTSRNKNCTHMVRIALKTREKMAKTDLRLQNITSNFNYQTSPWKVCECEQTLRVLSSVCRPNVTLYKKSHWIQVLYHRILH